MSGLVLKQISKKYNSGVLALHNVNLSLDDGEFVAVVGGENSGKSTLLRLIAGLDSVDSGVIELGKRDITELDSKERDVAMIFNSNTLNPALSVYENIAYGLRIRKASEVLIDGRVKAIAEILGLSDILNRKPKTVTSAQRQKIALARAIVREPKLYLLDDPLSGLDGALKGETANVIVNLQARMSGTFVYATKNVNDAMSMATRIVVLKDAFVQQIDTPANLYDYPANTFVAFYIGSPTINFIKDCTLVRQNDGIYAQTNSTFIPVPENISARIENLDSYLNGDKKVIVGIRPEDITDGDGEFTLKAKINSCEQISADCYCDCVSEDNIALVAKVRAEKGEEVKLCPDLTKMYLFDSESRLTILAKDGFYAADGKADAAFKPLSYDEEQEILNPKTEKKNNKR